MPQHVRVEVVDAERVAEVRAQLVHSPDGQPPAVAIEEQRRAGVGAEQTGVAC